MCSREASSLCQRDDLSRSMTSGLISFGTGHISCKASASRRVSFMRSAVRLRAPPIPPQVFIARIVFGWVGLHDDYTPVMLVSCERQSTLSTVKLPLVAVPAVHTVLSAAHAIAVTPVSP